MIGLADRALRGSAHANDGDRQDLRMSERRYMDLQGHPALACCKSLLDMLPASGGASRVPSIVCREMGASAMTSNEKANVAPDAALLSLEGESSLDFPCIACAYFEYYATGEGRTLGLLVMHASSVEELRYAIRRDFGDYFFPGVKVCRWSGVPQGFEALDPRGAIEALDQMFEERPSYQFSAKLHYNAA